MALTPWHATYAALPGLLARAREQAGLTQTVLARRLDISESTVQRIEVGRADLRIELLLRWASVCGLVVTIARRNTSDLTCSPDPGDRDAPV